MNFIYGLRHNCGMKTSNTQEKHRHQHHLAGGIHAQPGTHTSSGAFSRCELITSAIWTRLFAQFRKSLHIGEVGLFRHGARSILT